MRLPMHTAVAIALAVSAFAAHAEPSTSAALFAKSTLLGVQAAARRDAKSGKVSSRSASCVQSLEPGSLVPVYESVIAANWSKAELADIETFLHSPLGAKYVAISQLKSANSMGERTSETMPAFTAAETAQMQAFQKTAAGHQLLDKNGFDRPESKDAIRQKIFELLHGCGVG